MTTTDPKVTQADRQFIYDLMMPCASNELEKSALEFIREGRGDDALAVQLAARHRTLTPAQAAGPVLLEALWTPPESAWSGLARALMMAFDMESKTPRQIFEHLRRTGQAIPQWLRDEPEMKHLDHVPSKGTRAVIIYRAMLEPTVAAITQAEGPQA